MIKLKDSTVHRCGVTAKYWDYETNRVLSEIDLNGIKFRFNIASKGGGKTDIELKIGRDDIPNLLLQVEVLYPEFVECAGEVARLELALSEALKRLSEQETGLQAANAVVTRLTASEAALKARVADGDTNLKRARNPYAKLNCVLLEIANLKRQTD